MVHAQTRIRPGEILWDFEIKKDHLMSTRRPEMVIKRKKMKREKNTWTLPTN